MRKSIETDKPLDTFSTQKDDLVLTEIRKILHLKLDEFSGELGKHENSLQ